MIQERPTAEDIKNYSWDPKDSPFFTCPEKFMQVGERGKAKFRIWDSPSHDHDHWGWVSGEKGEECVCVDNGPGRWPVVQFVNGYATNVTDFEVEKLSSAE